MKDSVDALDSAVTKVLVAEVSDERVVTDGLIKRRRCDDIYYADEGT